MFYTVYKVTNQINGKLYIGVHKTDTLDDGYMGSGKYLKRAIEKHGVENFTKEILFVFNNPDEMYAKEAELVTQEFLTEANTYNLKVGGCGGWDYINSDIESRKLKNSRAMDACRQSMLAKYGVEHSAQMPENKIKISQSMKMRHSKNLAHCFTGLEFKGKTHSDETKAKLSEKAKLRTGDKNSSFGTMWITNLETHESKKIKRGDQIPSGWRRGRKMIKRA